MRTARLDDVVPIDAPVRFVKIDVEGGELGVLQGGMRTLSTHKPFVVFEHGDAAEGYGTRPEDVYGLLVEGCGLAVSTLDGWLSGEGPFREDEFRDCVVSGKDYYFVAHPPGR